MTDKELIAEIDRLRAALMRIEHAVADARKSCAGEPCGIAEYAACSAYDIIQETLGGEFIPRPAAQGVIYGLKSGEVK